MRNSTDGQRVLGGGVAEGRWGETEARQVLGAWLRSGMSASSFARAHGFNPQRLLWWHKRVGRSDAVASPSGGRAPLTFVPARVTPAIGCAGVTVRLPAGLSIETSDIASVPPEWLAAFIEKLSKRVS